MKKIIFVFMIGIMLAGCGNFIQAGCENSEVNIYSFSGENEMFRVINGTGVLGGEDETFYGGILEIRDQQEFKDINFFEMTFYIDAAGEKDTILSNSVLDHTGNVNLNNQEIGQISGNIFTTSQKISAFEQNLYFELVTENEHGEIEKYIIPMKVKEIMKKSF